MSTYYTTSGKRLYYIALRHTVDLLPFGKLLQNASIDWELIFCCLSHLRKICNKLIFVLSYVDMLSVYPQEDRAR